MFQTYFVSHNNFFEMLLVVEVNYGTYKLHDIFLEYFYVKT